MGPIGPQQIVFYQTDELNYPMSGNSFQHNIVVGPSSGGGFSGSGGPQHPMNIDGNAYYNYGGGTMNSGGSGNAGSDQNPINSESTIKRLEL